MYRTTITLEDSIAEAGKDLAKLRGFKNSFSAYLAWLIERDDCDDVQPNAPKDNAAYQRRLERRQRALKDDPAFQLLSSGQSVDPRALTQPEKYLPKAGKGHSTKKNGKRKIAHLTDKAWVSLSIFGTVPAGWAEDIQSHEPKRKVRFPRSRFRPGMFGLDVTGESMNAAKGKLGPILPGDTVLVMPFTTASDAAGKIVAANIDGRTTLKRMDCPVEGDCHLQPESDRPEFAGRMHPLDEITVLGIVVGKYPTEGGSEFASRSGNQVIIGHGNHHNTNSTHAGRPRRSPKTKRGV